MFQIIYVMPGTETYWLQERITSAHLLEQIHNSIEMLFLKYNWYIKVCCVIKEQYMIENEALF